MNLKEKTALITLTLNTLLTLFKFTLFLFSGSLAVLAEAWHSFSDIGTSFMVYIAVKTKKNREPAEEEEAKEKPGRLTLEQGVSLGIGLFLLIVAILLIGKFFNPTVETVRNPLISGLIFIVFSLGSYLVYRFESNVGRQEKSVGLVSDGMHARTDMIASLITGFSLILYHLGVDIDRWVAGIIALFVLSFAIETIVNVTLAITRKEDEAIFRYRSYTIIAKLFSPRALTAVGKFLDDQLKIKFFGHAVIKKAPGFLLYLTVIGLGVWWLSTTAFTVQPSEEAIVERFGEPVDPQHPLGPGLHFKAPWPMDRVNRVETQALRRMNVGNITDPNTFALLWTQVHGTELPFLSGDNNYFYPYLVLHYRITSLYDFLYRHKNPEEILSGVVHQIAGKIFATKSFYDIALSFRQEIMDEIQVTLQEVLDQEDLRLGIEIVNVSFKDIHPPIMIADSFEIVIASYQEKERMINEALGYRNQNLPEKRGEAIRTRKEAEAYALEIPLRGIGDADKFRLQVPASEAVAEVTRKRLYLSAMGEALMGRKKILVDPKTGQPELWLNMQELLKTQTYDFEQGQF